MSKVLIACYFFPPYASIGGRRTTKFVKELQKRGHEIHVIGAENPYQKQSQWTAEAHPEGLHYYALPDAYPEVFRAPEDVSLQPDSLWFKLKFKLSYLFYSFSQPLRVFDPTFRWEKRFTQEVERILDEHNIPNLWVSVSPHYYAWYGAKIKAKRPEINFIIDFRDPWLSLRDFGVQEMDDETLAHEKKIITETLEQADSIFGPSNFILDDFNFVKSFSGKRVEVVHPYDPEDLEAYLPVPTPKNDGKIRFVYGGTLYTDLAPYLKLLADSLQKLKANQPALYQQLQFDFYSYQNHHQAIFSAHSEIVAFHKPVGKAIFQKVSEGNYVMIMYAEHNKNYRTTKFFENLPFQRPYFYLGPRGFAYEFIVDSGLGFAFDESEVGEPLSRFWQECAEKSAQFIPGISHEDYSLGKQVDILESMLK